MSQEAEIHEQQRRRKPARWETMARLEGRITQRQMTRLQTLRRKVTESKQRAKLVKPDTPADRITLNTFVRAAVELLFMFEHEIEGLYTEQEIMAALKSAVQDLRNRRDAEQPEIEQPDGEQPDGEHAEQHHW